MKKQILLFSIFFLFLILVLPAASAGGDEYSPDLTISRFTLSSGTFTVSNVGSKNSPATGFDVMVYYQNFDGSTYKQNYHCSRSIRPGYSRSINNTFQGSSRIKQGLIRVNPYKKFRESNYDNNVRYYKMIKVNTNNYTATEQAKYDGGYYWEYMEKSYNYGSAWKNGNSTVCTNGGYSPLISTNPIATSYQYWNGRRWTTINQPLYVNAVEIYVPWTKERKINYAAISGVVNNPNMRVFVDCGYAKFLTYNPSKNIWEGYVNWGSSKLMDALRIKIYSVNSGQTGTNDIMSYVSNVSVTVAYIKNAWNWLYSI